MDQPFCFVAETVGMPPRNGRQHQHRFHLFYTGGTLDMSPEQGRKFREWYAKAEAAASPPSRG